MIARPFVGTPGHFIRTKGRRDYSVEPVVPTLLDAVKEAGMECLGVGKIEDIFYHRGLTGSNHAAGNPACIDAWMDYMRRDFQGLVFTNLVDTDMLLSLIHIFNGSGTCTGAAVRVTLWL